MRLDQIDSAARLKTKLSSLQERRETWAKVNMTDPFVPRRLNANGSSMVDRIPMLDDDGAMHGAIVLAIVAEYDRRIKEAKDELVTMGVEGIDT